MNTTIIKIFFFSLIPIGIFFLIKGIRFIKNRFSGNIILEIPFAKIEEQFLVLKNGIYAVWQKGELFKRTPINKFKPVIYNKQTSKNIKLNYSITRPHVNGFKTGRTEIFTFHATKGKYQLKLTEGSSISKLESEISKVIPGKSVDLSKYFIQIRESQPAYYTISGIIMIVLSALCIIGGIVLGLLTDKIF